VATQSCRACSATYATLKPNGVLFSSNPRGPDVEGMQGDRYGAYLTLPTWRAYLTEQASEELGSTSARKAGRSRAKWLATVWRRLG
jgi:hypothetical protein